MKITRKYYHKAVAPIIATLLMVAIAVVGGTYTCVLSTVGNNFSCTSPQAFTVACGTQPFDFTVTSSLGPVGQVSVPLAVGCA